MRVLLLKMGRLALSIFLLLLRWITGNRIPPIPSAHLVVRKSNRYLVIERSDGQGIGFPAGVVNWNETPAQTAIRETEEETGLKATLRSLVGVYNHTPQRVLGLNSIYIVYAGRITGGKLRKSLEGQPCWLAKELILRRQPDLVVILSDYEKRRP